MQTDLKLATIDDGAIVFGLMQSYYAEARSALHPKKHRWTVEKLLANPAVGLLWLILVDRTVVGYVVITFSTSLETGGRDGYLDDMFLVALARGRGIGRTACGLALEHVARLGVQYVHVELDPKNGVARARYQKLGFVSTERPFLMSYATRRSG